MSKEKWELRKKNNAREELISKENDAMYTDMIVYLRYADISEYNQEMVRADLIELILDGQERGDDIAEVMGSRYKEICDEIIESMPKRTMKEKIMKGIDECLWMICSLGVVTILMQFLLVVFGIEEQLVYVMTWGNFVSLFIILLVAEVLITYLKKDLFRGEKEKSSKKIRFKEWLYIYGAIIVVMIPNYLLQQIMFTIPIVVAILVLVALIGVERLIARIY